MERRTGAKAVGAGCVVHEKGRAGEETARENIFVVSRVLLMLCYIRII